MYYFVVDYWDELDQEPATDSGVTFGKNYGKAINRIVDYYGRKNVVRISIHEIEDVITEEEMINMFEEEEN